MNRQSGEERVTLNGAFLLNDMWTPVPYPGILLKHGMFSFDCRDCGHDSIKYKVVAMDANNQVVIGIRLARHFKLEREFIGYNPVIIHIPYFEYQVFLWDYILGEIRDFSGQKSITYFHFDEGADRGIAANLKLLGELKWCPGFTEYRSEIDFIICEPPGQPLYSIINFHV